MKIGLLAYHSAINFGATLQLLSTFMYMKNHGHTPIIINWVPKDLEAMYNRLSSGEQDILYRNLRKNIWTESRLCRTDRDVAEVIREENIEAVVVGSDAVTQHHPFIERIVFPSRRIIGINEITSDRLFPNPFWGVFNEYLDRKVPVALLSGSSQDSAYQYISASTKRAMKTAVEGYSYMSVRDDWTQKMIQHVTKGTVVPPVTPDPVFAFRFNAESLIPSKEEILKRFHLPEKYFVLSFLNDKSVSQGWLTSFEQKAAEKGIACVSLPFSHKDSFGSLAKNIALPLSPIDWFAVIRYSQGYIGNNMHPVIVSIHNNVPFFSFDNYGRTLLGGRRKDEQSSKILHLLRQAGLSQNRISCIASGYKAPRSEDVLEKLLHFDLAVEKAFAEEYYKKYQTMMSDIIQAIS